MSTEIQWAVENCPVIWLTGQFSTTPRSVLNGLWCPSFFKHSLMGFLTILSVTFLQLYLKMGLFNYKIRNENKTPVHSTACNTCSTCSSANLFSSFKRSPRVSLNHLALWNIEKWRDCTGWSFIIHCYISPYEYLIGYLRLKPHNNTSPDLCKTHIFPRFFV